MKTLLLTEIFPPRVGGSGRWFYEIYRRLPRERFAVAAGAYPGDRTFDQTHDLNLRRLPLTMPVWAVRSFRGLRDYGRAFRRIRRIVRGENVEFIHAGRMLPEGWIAWLLRRLGGPRYACYVHGEETNYGVQSRELAWMMRRVLGGADYVIANSHNTARILADGWHVAPERIRVLHPGADVERFVPAPRAPAVRASLGWGDRKVILTVGRLQTRKGHDRLIEALPTIRQTTPDVLYAIVGEGEERARLEELAAKQGVEDHVLFMGEITDSRLVECYQQCDLFVLPNREVNGDIEGFGMVLVEAQACGRPVVAGASGGTAETMNMPHTGRIVRCDDAGELASIVIELLSNDDLRARMGQSARQWAVENFGWEQLAAAAEELFASEHQELLAGNTRRAGDVSPPGSKPSEPATLVPLHREPGG